MKAKTDLSTFTGFVVWSEPEAGIHYALVQYGSVYYTRCGEINYQTGVQDYDHPWRKAKKPFPANDLNFPMSVMKMDGYSMDKLAHVVRYHPTMQLFVTRPVEGETIESWDYFGGEGEMTDEAKEIIERRKGVTA